MRKSSLLTFLMILALANISFGSSADEQRRRANSAFAEYDQEFDQYESSGYSKSVKKAPAKATAPKQTSQAFFRNAPASNSPRQEYKTYEGNSNAGKSTNTATGLAKPTIIILASGLSMEQTLSASKNSKNYLIKPLLATINQYFSQRKYNLIDIEAKQNIEKGISMQNDIKGSGTDMSYKAALTTGADIYITFAGSIDYEGNASIELTAYETITARVLGSKSLQTSKGTRSDKEAIKAQASSIARQALPDLEAQIQAYWKEDGQTSRYRVIMEFSPNFSEEEVEDLQSTIKRRLRRAFKQIKVENMTRQTADMTIAADRGIEYTDEDGESYALSDGVDVYDLIRSTLKGSAKVSKKVVNQKLIMMDIK